MPVLLLDVDNTLYAPSCGIVERVDALMDRYVIERLGVEPSAVGVVRAELRREHGTTLRGLMVRHAIDPDDYLRFVHTIELADVLARDPGLEAMLRRIPHAKIAVTNAPRAHATAVLDCLGVRHVIERIYAMEALGYVGKPEAFSVVLDDLRTAASECILVEDNLRNLTGGRRLGMRTVYVADDAPPDAADVVIASIHELEAALPRLA